jgi:LysR family transcriptional regulator, hydrogen peroxide-inducible genes activator
MSIRNLGFRDLQYVVAVAEHQSFSRAAEACAITQPALSERIKRIEFTLDVELFERTKRSLTVTAVGERLVARARALLQDAVEIDGMLTASREPLSGPIRVGVIATLGPYLMPLILPALCKQYPAVELILREGLTEPLLATLQAGDLDVVIAAAPLHAPGMTQLALFDEPFVLAVPIEHPLAQRPVVHATDLRGDEMVLLDDGHCLSGQALDVCPAKQRHNQNRLHAMSLETLRHMVAAGAGYSLMPALAVGRKPALSKLIRYKKLGGKRQYGRKLVLAWRKSFSRDADVRLLATLIRACLPTEMVAAA